MKTFALLPTLLVCGTLPASADCHADIVAALERIHTSGPVRIEAVEYRGAAQIHMTSEAVPGVGYRAVSDAFGYPVTFLTIGKRGWMDIGTGWSEMDREQLDAMSGQTAGEAPPLLDSITGEMCVANVMHFAFRAETFDVTAELEIDPETLLPRRFKIGPEGTGSTVLYQFDPSIELKAPKE